MSQTHLADLYDAISLRLGLENIFEINLEPLVAILQSQYEENPLIALTRIDELGQNLRSLDESASEILEGLRSLGNVSGTAFEYALATIGLISINGSSGNDSLNGSDTAEVLIGGLGADLIYGRYGDDAYEFNLGDGADTVAENANSGTNTLRLGAGITVQNTRLGRNANNDLILSFGNGDSVTIREYFFGNANGGRIENIVFADGTVWNYEAVTGLLTTQGTANADYLYALNGAANRIEGMEGDDRIYGADGADRIDGGAGNDNLYGYAGNDTLIGGEGSDQLIGGIGNDTYLFGRGQGVDTLVDTDSTQGNSDRLQFDASVAVEQLWFRQVSNNLEVSVIGSTDTVTISNWYLGGQYQVETFAASDGQVLLSSQVQNLVQAMAAFSPPAAGETTLAANYQSTLNPVIAANWN